MPYPPIIPAGQPSVIRRAPSFLTRTPKAPTRPLAFRHIYFEVKLFIARPCFATGCGGSAEVQKVPANEGGPRVPNAAAALGWRRDAAPAECRRTFTTGCQGFRATMSHQT